ncbi:hypothetical protein FHS10_003906 [Mucilaginibacter dorajii]|nr:hypothetical protein [Mucilaginibacter dorajii]
MCKHLFGIVSLNKNDVISNEPVEERGGGEEKSCKSGHSITLGVFLLAALLFPRACSFEMTFSFN